MIETEINVNTMLFIDRKVNSLQQRKLVSCDLGFVLYVAATANEGQRGLAQGRCVETEQLM